MPHFTLQLPPTCIQAGYFVIDSVQQLMDATAVGFTPLHTRLTKYDDIALRAELPAERILPE